MGHSQADFSSLALSSEPRAQAWLERARDHAEVQASIDQGFSAVPVDYDFFLDYQDIQQAADEATVTLTEANKIYYSTDPASPSETRNLAHTITLKKASGAWKIVDDTYDDEIGRILQGTSTDRIRQNIENKRIAAAAGPDPTRPGTPPEAMSPLLVDYPYDRQKAIDYTYQFWWTINSRYHDELAFGDCTNFASQAIYDGTGQTMSAGRNYNTDWYYDFYTHSGSNPWINVAGIYSFLTSNSGAGPYGYSSGSYLCYLGKGDVIVMKQAGQWKHTVVVSSVTECHDPSRVRVDAHDLDSDNRPLADYAGFDEWYAIDIWGYRK